MTFSCFLDESDPKYTPEVEALLAIWFEASEFGDHELQQLIVSRLAQLLRTTPD